MPKLTCHRGSVLLALSIALAASPATGQAQAFLSMGTGSPSGLYYPVGRALCDVINQSQRQHGVRCSAESTVGSVYNLEGLLSGDLDLALVQSDVQYNAYEGRAAWADRPDTELRSILSVHPELVTILARGAAGVANVQDLKGKRVDIGRAGSGAQATWAAIETALGWTEADLAHATDLNPDSAGAALCAGDVDASVQLVGHPSQRIADGLGRCDLVLVNVLGPEIAEFVVGRPYYRPGEIAAGMYGANPATPTFGVSATLVASADLPDEVAHVVAKSIIEGVDQLRARNPVLAQLEPREMVRAGLTAPLHPGAERAYRELGLIK